MVGLSTELDFFGVVLLDPGMRWLVVVVVGGD